MAVLPLVLVADGRLSRGDGVILLSAFLFHLFWIFSKKERFSGAYNGGHPVGFKHFLKEIFIFLGSLILLLASAELIIHSAVSLAESLHIPSVCIGILLIGAGTALPETYFVVRAAIRGKKEMILGNLMGAVVITSLFVLGTVALIRPIEISDFSPYLVARLFLILSALLFFVFIRTGERISRKESLILILVYLGFVAAEILI
jgi:cation:H+ antiporter